MMILKKLLCEIESYIYAVIKFLPGFSGKFLRKIYLKNFLKIENNFVSETGLTISGYQNINIKNFCNLGYNNFLIAKDNGSISIGNNFSTSNNVIINSSNGGKIKIGDNVLVAPNVVIRASDHIYDQKDKNINQSGHKPGEIIIGDNVWIGANTVILKNVKISDGAIIGAGSIITKNVESNTIMVKDNKVLKKRF